MHPFQAPMMNSNFDEEQWVIYISQALDDEDDDELETKNTVHIFNVPATLMAIDPFCFTPQVVSIGPYHFSRSELNEMELYKLSAAKRNQSEVPQDFKITNLVECLTLLEPVIRASYHRYFYFRAETLVWMMAVDASFLIEFLQICAASKEGKETGCSISSRKLSHLVDLSQNITNSVILRDIIMLENQIPLFVLRKLLELQFSSVEKADEMLHPMLIWLCEELSPFKISKQLAIKLQAKNYLHLLDVLFCFVVPKMEGFSDITGFEEETFHVHEGIENIGEISGDKEFILGVWKKGPGILIKKIKFFNPLKKIVKLPLTILSNVPLLKDSILQKFFNSQDTENNEQETAPTSNINGFISKPPLLEEIEIPSVSDLTKAGVCFKATNKGIESISFDIKTSTFFLPTISLDENSPIVLRNLVAYEACTAKGPLVLTRYTELLNGIIDTQEDARLLRERGIIVNRLRSDEEVTNLCNGMCKSLRLTKVPALDKVIEDVNKFYNGTWRVKLGRYMKKYVFESWRLLTLFAAILMIGFMGLQTFCSIYNCSRAIYIEQLN